MSRTGTGPGAPIKSFSFKKPRSKAPQPKPWKLNGAQLYLVPQLDGLTLLEFSVKMLTAVPREMLAKRAGANPQAYAELKDMPLEVATGLDSVQMINDLLHIAIMPDSWDLFEKTVKAPDSGIELEELTEIVLWIFEQYGGQYSADGVPDRPTEPSSV